MAPEGGMPLARDANEVLTQCEFTAKRCQRLVGMSVAVMLLGFAGVVVLQFGFQQTQASTAIRSDPQDHVLLQDFVAKTNLARVWSLDATKPFLVAPKAVIFQEDQKSVDRTISSSVVAETVTSDSSKSYASKLAAKLGLLGSYGFWGPESLAAAAEMSLSSISSSNGKKFRMDKVIKVHNSKITMTSPQPYKVLTEGAKRVLLHQSPEKIQMILGEFYATEAALGGIFHLTVVMEMNEDDSEHDLRAKLEGSMNNIVAKAHGGQGVTAMKIGGKTAHAKLQVLGGDTGLWLGHDSVEQIQLAWTQSVNDQNEYPIGFKLIPIWDLLDNEEMDRAKANKLKDFMIHGWNDEAKMSSAPDALPGFGGFTDFGHDMNAWKGFSWWDVGGRGQTA